MIRHMYIFGVLVPTLITVVVFVGFLICWFKFNIKDRVLKSQFFKKHFTKTAPVENLEVMSRSLGCSHDNSNHSNHWEAREPLGGDTNHQSEIQDNKRNLLQSNYTEDGLSLCPMDDSNIDQCAGTSHSMHKKSSKNSSSPNNFIANPNWYPFKKEAHMAPSPLSNQSQPNGLVQQTFHFSDLVSNKPNLSSVDLQFKTNDIPPQNTESDNYGHFVPPDQVDINSMISNATKPNHKHDKPLPINSSSNSSDPYRQDFPVQSIWQHTKTCAAFQLHPNFADLDPISLASNSHCVKSVQDYNKMAAKFPFPTDHQATLITGI